jgi:hypothetical protein
MLFHSFVLVSAKVVSDKLILLALGTRFVMVLRLPTPPYCLYEASLSIGFNIGPVLAVLCARGRPLFLHGPVGTVLFCVRPDWHHPLVPTSH